MVLNFVVKVLIALYKSLCEVHISDDMPTQATVPVLVTLKQNAGSMRQLARRNAL